MGNPTHQDSDLEEGKCHKVLSWPCDLVAV